MMLDERTQFRRQRTSGQCETWQLIFLCRQPATQFDEPCFDHRVIYV